MEVPAALADRLRQSRHVLVLTGSGVSAESGVPTFRDAHGGHWARFSPEDLATPEAFQRNPGLVWEWYTWRRQLVRQARPNAAHYALVALPERLSRMSLVTQNVDGLHQRAGSRAVIEFHGNILRDRCSGGCGAVTPAAEDASGKPPACRQCGEMMRPDVVWFGEPIPHAALQAATTAAEDCDLFVSAGTSSLVYPAAGLAEIALRAGAAVVEINPDPTPLSSLAEHSLRGPAGRSLPALLESLESAP